MVSRLVTETIRFVIIKKRSSRQSQRILSLSEETNQQKFRYTPIGAFVRS